MATPLDGPVLTIRRLRTAQPTVRDGRAIGWSRLSAAQWRHGPAPGRCGWARARRGTGRPQLMPVSVERAARALTVDSVPRGWCGRNGVATHTRVPEGERRRSGRGPAAPWGSDASRQEGCLRLGAWSAWSCEQRRGGGAARVAARRRIPSSGPFSEVGRSRRAGAPGRRWGARSLAGPALSPGKRAAVRVAVASMAGWRDEARGDPPGWAGRPERPGRRCRVGWPRR